jgi:hypothetical protein
MRKNIQAGLGIVALAALAAAATEVAAQAPSPWLHVRVEEAKDATKVAVNLPLSVVEAVLKASPEMIEKHGKIHIGHEHGLKLADLRKVWKELAAVGDAELVTVESEDENVRVQRKGDVVLVLVDKKPRTDKEGKPKGRGEQVRVEVPVSLVDALLSGEGEEANIEAAVMELKKRRGDIVRVQDDDSHVRVWIDEQNTQGPAPAGK